MSGVLLRLDRLRDRFRPPGCAVAGPSCSTAWDVRSDTDGPSDLPTRCPAYGRPRLVRTVVLVGVDVRQL